MFRRRYRRTHHRNTQSRGPFGFLRKPAVQIGIVVVTGVVIYIIAIAGGGK